MPFEVYDISFMLWIHLSDLWVYFSLSVQIRRERAGKKLNLLFIPCISNENVPSFFLFRCSEHLKLSIRVSFYWLICSPFVALLHLHCECKRAYWDFKSTLMFYHVWYVCCYSSIQRSFWLHFNGRKNAVNIKNSTSALANVYVTSF